MENDAPTAAGPTPDSEESNNANEKESPGPSTVESTSKEVGEVNEDRIEGSATPKSAGSDVTGETSGDVTVGSKAPDEEANVTETPETETDNAGDKSETMEGETNEPVKGDDQPEAEDDRVEANVEEGAEAEDQTKNEGQGDNKVTDVTADGAGGASASESAADEEAVAPNEEVSGEPDRQEETADKESKVEDSGVEETDDAGAKSEDAETNERSTDDQTESENPDNNDAVSSASKIGEPGSKVEEGSNVEEGSKHEDGYSADNETTTAASIDTGEVSQSGLVVEQDDLPKAAAEVEPPKDKEVKVQEEEKEEATPLSYDELLIKYHATELQLDGLKEDNNDLSEKIKQLENEIQQLREGTEQDKTKQRDGYRVQADFLARELSQTQDAENFLKEKVAELLEEKEEGEKRVRDLQLRLKRFAKDDKAKDERIGKMETELKEITEVIQELESYVDEETRLRIQEKRASTRQSTVSGQENSHTKVTDMNKLNTNRSHRDPEPVQRSRTCVII